MSTKGAGMNEVWGSVDGDVNADAIISDRRDGKKAANLACALLFPGLVIVAIWLGMTGSHAALAIGLVIAVLFLRSAVAADTYGTHTFVMIAERRAQLLEQKVQELQTDLAIKGRL